MLISAEPRSLSLPLALAILGLWLCPAEGAIELADDSVNSGPAGYSLLGLVDEAVEAADAPVQRGPSATVPFTGTVCGVDGLVMEIPTVVSALD